jgi:hypothetical protein
MRVLPVQVDQKLADGLELGQRRGAAVDVRAASALRIEHAAQQERSVLREIVFDEPCQCGRRILQIELGGYFRAVGAGTFGRVGGETACNPCPTGWTSTAGEWSCVAPKK